MDIPSGLNGLTGIPSPVAVMADATVTFEEPKVGLFLPEAKEFVGKLIVGKIGIPQKVKLENPPSFYGIPRDIIKYLPDITDMAHKISITCTCNWRCGWPLWGSYPVLYLSAQGWSWTGYCSYTWWMQFKYQDKLARNNDKICWIKGSV